MRNPDNIQVTQGILHLIGQGPQRDTILSDTVINFENTPEVKLFVENHIRNSLRAEQTISAQFVQNAGPVRNACSAVFRDPQNLNVFFNESRNIAMQLGNIIREDGRLAIGGVLITQFRHSRNEEPVNATEHIAILKLDSSRGFTPETRQQNDGRTFITLQSVEGVVPSTREQLQKCAFVCNPAGNVGVPVGCDLFVLDRQQKGLTQAADFFLGRFLDATRLSDDISLTKTFDDIAVKAINSVFNRGLIDDETRNTLYAHRTVALRSRQINVNQFLANLPVADNVKDILRVRFNALPEIEFTPDEQTAIKLTHIAKFRGENGLILAIEEARYDEMVAVERIEDDQERGPHFKITIKSRDWRAVRGR